MSTPPVDTNFAPWSLMTPDPARPRREEAVALSVPTDDRSLEPPGQDDDGYMFGEDGFSFADFLDIVNPLQHLPIVSTIYREITGDRIDPGARMAGGVLYGGPLGLAGAVLNSAIEAHSGRDIGGHIMTAFTGEGDADDSGTSVAAATLPTDATSGGSHADAGDAPLEITLTGAPFAGAAAGGGGASAPNAEQMAALFGGMVAGAPAGRATPAARYDIDADTRTRTAAGFSSPAAGEPREAGANPTGDYAGITRISPKLAAHLAMLAQQSAPTGGEAPTSAPVSSAPAPSASAPAAPLPQPFAAREHAGNPFAPAAPPSPESSVQSARAGIPADGFDTRSRHAAAQTDPSRIRDAMAQALRRYEEMKQNQG